MSKISIFHGAQDANVKGESTINEFLVGVRDGAWRKPIEALAKLTDPAQKEAAKKRLPAFTMSGLFAYREASRLLEHSGFICFDFDKLNDEVLAKKAALEADPYTYAVGLSSSGKGLFCLVRIDGARHLDAWQALDAYYLSKYGLVADPKAKDLPRLRFASHDPTLYINEKSVLFKAYLPKKQAAVNQRQAAAVIYTTNDVDKVIEEVVSRGINLTADDYERYYKIAFALISEFGDGARQRFHLLCQTSAKYDPANCDKQFNYCLRSPRQAGGNAVGIGSLFYYAKEAGVQTTSKETQSIARVAAQARKLGGDKAAAVHNVEVARLSGTPENIAQIINQVFDAPEGVSIGDETDLLGQLELFLHANYQLKRNDITKAIEHKGTELSTADYNSIYIAAKKSVSDKVTQLDLFALINSDFVETYNPIHQFFENNRNVDGAEGCIEALAASITTDTGKSDKDAPDDGFVAYFLRKWLVGMIASAHGYHSPLLLALCGGINTGKTWFFRHLLPAELAKFYGESKLDSGKDDELLMTQKLIIMDDELGGKSKRDNTRLKELTSKQVFSLREPYGKKNSDFQRLAMLCGTSNEKDLLTDPSGNRRIIPINVLGMKHDEYNAVNKKGLIIEAYKLYLEGYNYDLTNEDVKRLNQHTGEFEAAINERELIDKYFRVPGANDMSIERMSTTEVQVYLQNVTNLRLSLKAIGSQMQSLGFVRSAVRKDNRTVWLYKVARMYTSGQENAPHEQLGQVGPRNVQVPTQQAPVGDEKDQLPF
jgi:predicted P-loop ATPase